MPNVQLPGGEVVSFPDDMSPQKINEAIETHLAAQQDRGALGAAVSHANDMATFGLSSPVSAAGIAAIEYARGKGNYGDLYDKSLAFNKEAKNASEEQHPVASAAGTGIGFAGGMGALGRLGEAAMYSDVPAQAAAKITPSVIRNIGRNVRNNALISAGIGEANAVANTPGSMQAKIAAAYPAGIDSAAVGATIPLGAQGITSGVKAVGKKALSPIINKFFTPDSDVAMAKIAKRFAQDNNITPEQAQAILQNLGPNASLADAGGANVQKLGKTILNTPGAGANNTSNFLLGRQKGMVSRVQDMVKAGFGTSAEFNDTVANLQAAKQETAAPLYQQAFAANQNVNTPAINRILKTPAGQSALKAAGVKMQNDMTLMGVNDPELAEQAQLAGQYVPGQGGVAGGLKLRTLDYVKRALDDQISVAQRAGENDNVRILVGMKNNLVKSLDAADVTAKAGPNSFKPEGGMYAKARAAWSGPSQSQDALEMGRNFMNEDAQITANDVANLPEGDKHFFQIGAARAIGDKAAANPSNTVKNIIGNNLWKQRLQSAMPSEDAYYDFMTNAHNEATMQGTKNAVMGNSSTASQLRDMAEEGGNTNLMPYDLNVGNIIDASQGDLKGTAMQIGRHYFNKAMAPSPGVSDQLSNMLFNPQKNAETIQNWQKFIEPQYSAPFQISPKAGVLGVQGAALIGSNQSGSGY